MSDSTAKRHPCLILRRTGFAGLLLASYVFAAPEGSLSAFAQSEAKMSQMLNQFESGKRQTYTTGGRSMGRASGMPGYANMMGGGRPSNMGGYAGMGSRGSSYSGMASRPNSYAGMGGGGSSQMMQLMKQKLSRMQSGGAGTGGGTLMQLMQQKRSGMTPNTMPGMGGGSGPGMGMQSGLFAKMMQQDATFNKNMRRQQMSHGMGMNMGRMGGMGMGMPGMGMARTGSGMSMNRSGMGMPTNMAGGAGGMFNRMGQSKAAPKVGSPFASKAAAPAKSGQLSDLEKQMESQYGK
jgi:hypothetical protein